MKEISERIKRLADEKGLEPENIADKLGVDLKDVLKWESGELLPGRENAEKLSELLGVSLDFLIFGREDALSNITMFPDRAESPTFDSNFLVGMLTALVGIIGIVILMLKSISSPRLSHFNGRDYTGFFGYLLGEELLWAFILFCILMISGVIWCFIRSRKSKRK